MRATLRQEYTEYCRNNQHTFLCVRSHHRVSFNRGDLSHILSQDASTANSDSKGSGISTHTAGGTDSSVEIIVSYATFDRSTVAFLVTPFHQPLDSQRDDDHHGVILCCEGVNVTI
jgi:hypothetical protein